jgi:transcriptional regulator with XRE-family HTH domain
MTAPESPVPLSVAFGRRTRSLRTRRGWSQERLGACPGLTTASVRRIERGENTMLLTAEAVATAFGVKLAVMLDPESCPVCHDAPQRGFICGTCGAKGPEVTG